MASDIIDLFRDEEVCVYLRSDAISVLGNLVKVDMKQFPKVLEFIKDENVDKDIRWAAANELKDMEIAIDKYIPTIINTVKN